MSANTWNPNGPAPEQSKLTGDVSGRVISLAVSTDHDGRGTPALFIGVEGGGVWRSTNFETGFPTWTCVTDAVPPDARRGIQMPRDLVVHPSRPGTLYLCAGDPAFGVLASVDGGSTWTILTKQFAGEWPLRRLLVDPTDVSGNTLYVAGGNAGFQMSTNGGVSFAPDVAGLPSHFRASDLECSVDAQGRLTLYLAVSSGKATERGVWRRDPGSPAWNQVPIQLVDIQGTAVTGSDIGNILLAADRSPATNGGVFAAFATDATPPRLMNVFRLNAAMFSSLGTGLPSIDLRSAFAFRMAPDGSLYIGGVNDSRPNHDGIFQSTDAGAHWTSIDVGSNGLRPHTDQHTWAFFNGRVYNGNDGGIYRFTPRDNRGAGPGTWESLNTATLQTILTQGVGPHPTTAGLVLCGSQDNAIALLKNGIWREVGGDDAAKVRFDPDPQVGGQYAYQTGMSDFAFFFRSDDGGETWADHSPPDAKAKNAFVDDYAPFAIHPTTTSRIVVGIDRVYETRNRGDSWSLISPTFPSRQSTAIAYATNDIIWVACNQEVYLTVNGGGDGTWTNWRAVGQGTNFGGVIVAIAIDPRYPGEAYLASDGGRIWHTPNQGMNWLDVTSNFPGLAINTLAIVPGQAFDPPLLFVGTREGIYLSFDQGASWGLFNQGMPFSDVRDLQYAPAQRTVWAALYGRGVWVLDVAGIHLPTAKITRRTNECGTPAAVGSVARLGLTITDAPVGQAYTVQWNVQNAQPAPGETGTQPTFQVTLGSMPGPVTVTVVITFAGGTQISATLTFAVIPSALAVRLESLCKIIHDVRVNVFVNPLWDPLRDYVVHPLQEHELTAARDELASVVKAIEGLLRRP